jgi:hypothetical protein
MSPPHLAIAGLFAGLAVAATSLALYFDWRGDQFAALSMYRMGFFPLVALAGTLIVAIAIRRTR